MPTICRFRSAPCTPTSSARRMRMPTSLRIDASAALAHDGVWAVITGEDVRKLSDPFLAAVKTPVQQWSLAVERVRYVGEPVALVVAESRYIAEDAAELVDDRIRAARSGDRSARGVREIRAAAPSAGRDQRSLGARILLWRHRGGVRARRSPHRHDDGISAAVVHADRMLRRGRRSTIRPKAATTCWRISRARSPCIR